MKILAIEKELQNVNWGNKVSSLKQEAQYVYKLYIDNFIREIYFNQNHNAVLVIECESIEKAKLVLNDLPLVKNKLIDFELMELNPYTGYSRLFEDKK